MEVNSVWLEVKDFLICIPRMSLASLIVQLFGAGGEVAWISLERR